MVDKLSLYHALPPPLRDLAATLRGYQLRRWRYGPETEQLIGEAIERESWSQEKWAAWQAEQVARVLHQAATRVPYYQAQWSQRKRNGDRASWEVLSNWPVLAKTEVRQNPLAFLTAGCDPRSMFPEHTSGTTGSSLHLWWSKNTVRNWYALFEARCRLWYGVSRHSRWGILGGQLVTPFQQTRPPFWVWNAALNQLYMSSYHLSAQFIPDYLDAIDKYQLEYLWGYSSSLYSLAITALENNLSNLKLKVVITNAEPLYAYQREAISAAFHCPVRETYGMAEIVAAASECSDGKMHLWPEAGILEVLADDNDEQVSPGESGSFVATGLINQDMPLIRYDIGDRGRLAPQHERCTCGRNLPILDQVEGRVDDVLISRDGRRIGRLDPIFKSGVKVREAQILQECVDTIHMKIVPAEGYSEVDHQRLTEQMRLRLGDVKINIEKVSAIPREKNGKFRAVISNLTNGRSNSR